MTEYYALPMNSDCTYQQKDGELKRVYLGEFEWLADAINHAKSAIDHSWEFNGLLIGKPGTAHHFIVDKESMEEDFGQHISN